jgi:hypothetical protein
MTCNHYLDQLRYRWKCRETYMVSFRILCSDPFLDSDCLGVMEPFMMLDTAVWIAGAICPSALVRNITKRKKTHIAKRRGM